MACTPDERTAAPSPSPVDPDAALITAAQARERALLAAYRVEAVRLPHLATELQAFADDHIEHLMALGGEPGTLLPTPPTAAQRADSSRPAVAARKRLAALERIAGAEHAKAAGTASLKLAPVLASMCACESAHAAVL